VSRTLRFGALALAAVAAADAAVVVHATALGRGADRESARSIVRIVGFADLALSSNARWLRHPSHAEPWAAVTDQPASLDTEPAGAILGPPRP